MKDINLYKLSIDISGKSLSGSYSAFDSGPNTLDRDYHRHPAVRA